MDELTQKQRLLEQILRSYGSLAVAFSSGVDSTLLLYMAKMQLGDAVLAITARSASFPKSERQEAAQFCKDHGIRQIVFDSNELDIPEFAENPKNRCYICKKAIFSKICSIAAENGFDTVAEGSNLDDLSDYRPGLIAISELSVVSPLRAAGLTKAEIRALSAKFGLPTKSKPSFACLASRFPYGEPITAEKLAMVEAAEERLSSRGFTQYRVRIHGKIARIELLPAELGRIFAENLAATLDAELRKIGFDYVTLDLGGYKTGSLNRVLSEKERDLGLKRE